MTWHLSTARRGIRLGADRLQQVVVRCLAEAEHHGSVTIVREEPVVLGLAVLGDGDPDGFVSCSRNLEEDLVLSLQADLTVVDPA